MLFTLIFHIALSDVGKLIEREDREMGSVSWGVFLLYSKAMGWPLVCLVMIFLVAQYAVMIATDFWLSSWSEAGAGLVNATQVNLCKNVNKCC